MLSEEEQLLPQESLALIAEAIGKTRDNFKENSSYFLLWGWLIAAASLAFFGLHSYTHFAWFFLPFPVLVAIGIVATVTIYTRRRSISPTETYLGYFFSRMWMVLGLGFMVVVFVSVVRGILPFTYTMIIAGIGTTASGLAMKFRPLTAGGVLFFVAAMASVYFPANVQPLICGLSMVMGYLIPGYWLKSANV
jgi:hypothetical protein